MTSTVTPFCVCQWPQHQDLYQEIFQSLGNTQASKSLTFRNLTKIGSEKFPHCPSTLWTSTEVQQNCTFSTYTLLLQLESAVNWIIWTLGLQFIWRYFWKAFFFFLLDWFFLHELVKQMEKCKSEFHYLSVPECATQSVQNLIGNWWEASHGLHWALQ